MCMYVGVVVVVAAVVVIVAVALSVLSYFPFSRYLNVIVLPFPIPFFRVTRIRFDTVVTVDTYYVFNTCIAPILLWQTLQ